MNKMVGLMLLLTCLWQTAAAEELDDVIRYSLSNSMQGRHIQKQEKLAHLQNQSRLLSLLPVLSASADWQGGSYADSGYSIRFSESFSHVDSVIQGLRQADLDRRQSLIQVQLLQRDLAENIIRSYVDICLIRKKLQLMRTDITNQRVLYSIMKVRQQNGREIQLNLEKQSNQILLSAADLRLEEAGLENAYRLFLDYSGGISAQFELGGSVQSEGDDHQYELQARQIGLSLSNNLIARRLKQREQWLPRLDLSLSWDYDIESGSAGYQWGAGLSFSFLDYWSRRNTIQQLEIRQDELLLSLSNTMLRWNNALQLQQVRQTTLAGKIQALQQEVTLEKRLQELYRYQYETDQIDYHEYRRRQYSLLNAELSLLQLQGELYRLQKQLQYGILRP